MVKFTSVDLSAGTQVEVELTPQQAAQEWRPVARVITARQVRVLLIQRGLLDDVEQMIAAQDRETQVAWEYGTEFYRDDPLLARLAANLNLNTAEIDEFFNAAAGV